MSAQPEEDAPTVISSGSVRVDAVATESSDTQGLRIGMRLGEFEVTKRIGEGGFSIVYLAWDHSLERKVALKEYMPSSIAARVGSTQVMPRSERHRDTFDTGLRSFVNEGKLLAQFDHASLVKVYRFWEANGTAYMVMPLYEGVTLKDTVRALPNPPDETWLIELLAPLTEALCVIHAKHCYHRDIAPDNVMLLAGSGRPLLLDFGAARRVIGDMTQALTVILKPGYAPVEQYAEVPGMRQGPWTDVYALAAVVYWIITGKTPPTSVGRMMRDSYVPLTECAADRYSTAFLESIDRALVVLPEGRTQTIEALRLDLGLTERDQTSPPGQTRWVDPEATVIRPSGERATLRVLHTRTAGASGSTIPAAAPASTGQGSAPAGSSRLEGGSQSAHDPPSRQHSESNFVQHDIGVRQQAAQSFPGRQDEGRAGVTQAKHGRSRAVLGLAAFGASVVAAVLWWVLARAPVEPSATAPSSVNPTVASPSLPQPSGTAATPPQSPVAPQTPLEATQQLKAGSDPSMSLSATSPSSVLKLGRDALRLSLTSGEPGYAYVFGYRDGGDAIELLQPIDMGGEFRIEAMRATDLTQTSWSTTAPVAGNWRLFVMLSRHRRDLQAAGWHDQEKHIVRTFGPGDRTTTSVLGHPVCAPGSGECDPAYAIQELAVTVTPMEAAEITANPAAAQPEKAPVRAPPKVGPPRPDHRAESPGDNAACALVLQQLSLGDSSPELMERVKALKCR